MNEDKPDAAAPVVAETVRVTLRRADRLLRSGRTPEAISAYREALTDEPGLASAHMGLAQALAAAGEIDESIEVYREAASVDRADVEPHLRVAALLTQRAQHRDAVTAYEAALAIDPARPDALAGLGAALRRIGDYDRAADRLSEAVRLAPDMAEAHHDLGTVFQLQGRLSEAMDAYRQAIERVPGYLSAWSNLGAAAFQLGDVEAARKAFGRALKLDGDFFAARLGRTVSQLEVIYRDGAHIEVTRERYTEALAALTEGGLPTDIRAADAIGVVQPFLLPYQGRNDRDLMARYGGFIARVAAAARPQAAALPPVPDLGNDGRYRVGIVSAYFRNHSNWKIPIQGWLRELDRERFAVIGYHVGAHVDAETHAAAALCDRFVQGPLTLDEWIGVIGDDSLHVLIFPELGMDPVTLQLGCLRLAPVQATSWGHPNTSGLPTIDYFLSSDAMEPADGDTHYTEKLVRLAGLSTPYRPPAVRPAHISRASLNVADDDVLFWCCQSLFKYLPRYDSVFPAIAARAPASRFLFIEHRSEETTARFRGRLQRSFREAGLDADAYCRILPRMHSDEFAGVAVAADLFLDSIGWSGCNSTLEGITQGLPPLTLPCDTMRSRHTLAVLRELGLEAELVARDRETYVDLAVRLATDPAHRSKLRQYIVDARDRLFADDRAVSDLQAFIVTAVETARAEAPGIPALLAQARDHHRAGELLQAEMAYHGVLSRDAGHPDARHGLGVLAAHTGRPKLSRRLLNAVLTSHPDSAKTALALGRLEAAEGRWEDALVSFEQAIATGEDEGGAWLGAGNAALRLGRLDAALGHAERAVAAAGSPPRAHRVLSETLQALERYAEAAEAARTFLGRVNPLYARHVSDPPAEGQGAAPRLADGSLEMAGLRFPAIPPVAAPEQPRPFWSVVIPVCNRRRYLMQCLTSVLVAWPGHEHMEIVVIDNGSEPSLADDVAAIGGGIVRYRRHPTTIDLQHNWNSAVAECRGEWIHVLHDDDEVHPDFYRTLRSGLTNCSASVGAAFTAYELIGPLGEVRGVGRPFDGPRGIADGWLERIGVGNVLNPPCMVIRRDVYEKLGGYSDEILYTTDWELYKRIASSYDWWYEPAPLARYRQHPVNITAEQNKAGAQGFSIRRAVEMSTHYLPEASCRRITQLARNNYFDWCVEHLSIPVSAGNLDGGLRLLREALRLLRGDDALQRLFGALEDEEFEPLRRMIAEACHRLPAFQASAAPATEMIAGRLFHDLVEPDAAALRGDVADLILSLQVEPHAEREHV